MPDDGTASTESNPDCGVRWLGSLAWYDRATSSWRTYQRCLDGEWDVFSETFPRSATMRSGIVFPQQPLAPLTEETVSGLWPTATVNDSKNGANHTAIRHNADSQHHDGITLVDAVRMWPTPKGAAEHYGQPRENDWGDLQAAVRMWPTPHANCSTGAGTQGRMGGLNLQTAVKSLPTPTANRWDALQSHGVNVVSGQLNPTWVEWLMGFPIGWTDCTRSATQSCRRSSSGSRVASSTSNARPHD